MIEQIKDVAEWVKKVTNTMPSEYASIISKALECYIAVLEKEGKE